MTRVGFSLRRVALIAQNTLREAARQKLFHAFILLAFALVLGARWLRDFNFGAPELKFIADCGFGAMTLFGSALVITATVQLFFRELELRTAQTLLAKPVRRSEFVLGKFLGVALATVVFCALLTALLVAVLRSREAQLAVEFPEAAAAAARVSYGTVLTAGLLQCAKLVVLAALTLLIASFAQTQLFAVTLGFVVLVGGHLQYLAQDAYARAGAGLGAFVGRALSSVLPNFQVFAIADTLVAGEAPPAADVLRVLGYALGYIVVACALAIFCFRQREV
jgi:ABC-type transport system involved in multi-copper enzyme maturation permease subunit